VELGDPPNEITAGMIGDLSRCCVLGSSGVKTGKPNSAKAEVLPVTKETATSDSVVLVIDDDTSVRRALKDLFESVRLNAIPFASAAEFLRYKIPDRPCCLVLDVRMPEMSGLKLQEELARIGVQVPIVFLTGHGDIGMAVAAMKAGAVDFIVKPFRTQNLLDAVFAALERDRARRNQQEPLVTLRERFSSLSAREKEVLMLVAAGRLNKQIALALGIGETMVKVHRASPTGKWSLF
jgi:FixJ family two-component response regulator